MKQNGVVCYPGPALLFFIFRFEYLISAPKSYRDFRETGPRNPAGALTISTEISVKIFRQMILTLAVYHFSKHSGKSHWKVNVTLFLENFWKKRDI